MQPEIPVVKVTQQAEPVAEKKVSNGFKYPFLVYYVDMDGVESRYDSCGTVDVAKSTAENAKANGRRGVRIVDLSGLPHAEY